MDDAFKTFTFSELLSSLNTNSSVNFCSNFHVCGCEIILCVLLICTLLLNVSEIGFSFHNLLFERTGLDKMAVK